MSGEERIRRYVERAFYGTRQSDEVEAEKEALCGELIKKYRDLLAEEYSPETAYQSVIGGIGDIFELVDEIAGAPGDAPLSGGNAGTDGQDSHRRLSGAAHRRKLLRPGCGRFPGWPRECFFLPGAETVCCIQAPGEDISSRLWFWLQQWPRPCG